LTFGNNFYICISTDTKDEADRIFNELAEGGKIEMPLQDMFWGDYFGCAADKFGVQWMISFDKNRS
ncbi:MAG: VOC family protein, partial [Blastocatellia bacterium]